MARRTKKAVVSETIEAAEAAEIVEVSAVVEKVSAPVVQPAPPQIEKPKELPPPQLTQAELFLLRMAQLELKAAQSEVEASKFRRLYILAMLDPKGRVLAEEKSGKAADAAVKDAQAKYLGTLQRASKRLQMDLSKCSFDADTGQVFRSPP